eukprot:223914_1
MGSSCSRGNKEAVKQSPNILHSTGNTFEKLDSALYSYFCSRKQVHKRNEYYNSNDIGKIEILCYENEIDEERLAYNLDEIAIILANDETFPCPDDDIDVKIEDEFHSSNEPMISEISKTSKISKVLQNCYSNIHFYSDYNLEIKNDIIDVDYDYHTCQSVKHCEHINNIIISLKYYSEINQNQNQKMKEYVNYVNDTDTINIIQSFHHVLTVHLNVTKAENIENFEYIHSKITADIQQCSLPNCNSFIRNGRDRHEEQKYDNNYDYTTMFYIDLLDSIHTFFVHSYETGFRIKWKDIQIPDEAKMNFVDAELQYVQDVIKNIRKELSKINGIIPKQHENNKFTTQQFSKVEEEIEQPLFDLLYEHLISHNVHIKEIKRLYEFIAENEYDSDSVAFELTEIAVGSLSNICDSFGFEMCDFIKDFIDCTNDQKDIEYGFGERFYYWKHFKTDNFYVKPKFSGLKEDIISNGWPIKFYEQVHKKAVKYLEKSDTLQKLKSDYDFDAEHNKYGEQYYYGIDLYSHVQLQHIMAMLFYTDYTDLSYEISKSFRRISKRETFQTVKRRNSVYANISKELRELVECYGTRIYLARQPVFFHGTSKLYFNKFVTKFCGPISTTKHVEVATIFTDEDGIILELQQASYDDRNLKYFNCSLISTFINEDERFFCGGAHYIRFKSIILMRNTISLESVIKALTVFENIINGRSTFMSQEELKIMDNFFTVDAIQSSKFPDYVKKSVELFCMKKQEITINMEHIYWNYPSVAKCIIAPEMQNLLRFNVIVKLFRNAHTICCLNADRGQDCYSSSIINQEYMKELICQIEQLPKLKILKRIIITTNHQLSQKLELNSYTSAYWELKQINPTQFEILLK